MNFPDPTGVAECTFDELRAAVAALWPTFYTNPDDPRDRFGPVVDGHWRIGFSLRLFGPSGLTDTFKPDPAFPAHRARAWRAMEQLQRALEDIGYETTREGNAWQDGRLILGWALTADGLRIVDLPEEHPARTERCGRLREERAVRDAAATPESSTL